MKVKTKILKAALRKAYLEGAYDEEQHNEWLEHGGGKMPMIDSENGVVVGMMVILSDVYDSP